MNSRKASFDEYNATCDSINDGNDLNRAILMSFSDTLSSTQHNSTRDSLSSTMLPVNRLSDVDSTIVEKTFPLPVKQCTPKIIGDEILIDHYAIPRKETFVSRIPKYNDAKSKQTVGLNDDKKSNQPVDLNDDTKSNQPVGLNDDKKSNVVRVKKYFYDVENIKQSNLWPALTALETSLHSCDEQASPDDTDILQKLDEEFSASPRQFTATLMTIIEESFGELEEGNGDVSRFGLMELLKKTASSGKRLEDESPPEFMFSCFGRSKQTDHEAKCDLSGPDWDNNSNERFISLPSERQALANESAESSYVSFEALTITTGTERISTMEPKKYVNTAKITVHPDTPTNFTNWAANCRENWSPVRRMPRSPINRPRTNAVRFQDMEDESPQPSYSSFETLTVTTSTARISTKEPKKYVQTPRIIVKSGTPTNTTNSAANCRRNRTPVKRMPRSPINRPKTNAVKFQDMEDESPHPSYTSFETLRMTTGAGRISTKEPKKYVQTPRIIVESGAPTNATNSTANFRRNRTPVRRMLGSPVRPKTNAVSFEDIEDESAQSSYLSLETLRMTTGAGRISTKEPKKYQQTPRITVDPGTPTNPTNRAANSRRNRTPVWRTSRSPARPKMNAPSIEGIADHGRESPILSPLSNKDDDEYLTAESETEEVSALSENTKTDGSLGNKLDMSNIAAHHRKWVTTFEQHSKYTCNTSLKTTERKRKLSSHANKLEMRWLKKLTEKRQKCFDVVDEMLQKADSDPSEPEVKPPCPCSPCKLSKEFCSVLLAFQEYMQYAMHAPEVTKKDDKHRFVTSVKMNLKTKNSKSPRGSRKSMSKQRKSLNKMPSPRFLSSRVKSNPSPRNRGVSPKKTREPYVDTSSIRTVSQLRRVFSPRPGTAGCSESKNLGAKQTIPRKIPSSVGSERKGHMVFLPGHGPSHYKKVISPVGEYIRGKKIA